MRDHEKVYRYVLRFFRKHTRMEWPTVRRIASTLGWKQSRVHEAVEGDPDGRMMLTTYPHEDPPPGDHFVELYTEGGT